MKQSREAHSPLRKHLKKIFWAIPVLVVINITVSLWGGKQDLLQSLSAFNPVYFVLALGLGLMPWLTHASRIWLWTDFIKQKISFKNSLRTAIGSDLGAALTPTAVGGSPVKAAMLISNGVSPASSIVLSAITTLEDLVYFMISFLVIFVFSGFISESLLISGVSNMLLDHHALLYVAIAGTVLAFLYKVVFYDQPWVVRARNWFTGQVAEIRQVSLLIWKSGKRLFLLSLLLNTLQWLIRYLLLYVLLLSLGQPVGLLTVIALSWLVYFIMLFVPTPGAVLGAEAAFFMAFSTYLPAEIIGFVIFGWRFLTFYYQLSMGAVMFALLPYLTPIRRRLPRWMPFRLARFQS